MPAVLEKRGCRERRLSSHGLTGCSFTGLEVRCQSSVCEGESREGLSTGVPECEVTLCMAWGRKVSVCGVYILCGGQHMYRETLGAWSRLRRSLQNLNPPKDTRGSHKEAERCNRGEPPGRGPEGNLCPLEGRVAVWCNGFCWM